MMTGKDETFERNIREGRNYKISCYDNSKQSEQNIRGNRIIWTFEESIIISGYTKSI